MSEERATDILANERTFLAYARTALSFIAFGFVIARFSLFTREVAIVAHIQRSQPTISATFGTGMALIGVAFGGYGAFRFVTTARALRAGVVRAMPDGVVIAIGLLIAAIGLVVTWTLYAYR